MGVGHTKMGRDYRNYYMNQPWEHARHEVDMLLLSQAWDVPQKIQALERTGPLDFRQTS